jgi:hypothetical protein
VFIYVYCFHYADLETFGARDIDGRLLLKTENKYSGSNHQNSASPDSFFFEDLEIRVMDKNTSEATALSHQKSSSSIPGIFQPLSNILIQCRNNKCQNSCPIEEAQQTYKTCRNCHTYYCSRECRRAHKPKHVGYCLQLKASSLLTEVMHQIRDMREIYLHISKVSPLFLSHLSYDSTWS